ncbi:MAG: DNA-binding protein [Lachnospiraceae bacterium]|nr:DNA-binding protein [Lachnospiraceae bacterium]
MKVSDRVDYALLYDFYGALLTEHQQEVYEDVYFNDMSLSEVAKIHGISRQAVSDLIKRINKILVGYESKLELVKKFNRAKEKVSEIAEIAKELDSEKSGKRLNRIIDIADSVLDEF